MVMELILYILLFICILWVLSLLGIGGILAWILAFIITCIL